LEPGLYGKFSPQFGYYIYVVLLFIPKLRYRGLWVSALVMTIFTLYIIYILGFSREIPCGCGGILATMGWKEHLAITIYSKVATQSTFGSPFRADPILQEKSLP
jgi:hypothetical protein